MKAIVYFVTHHSINWPLIWSDCSPFIVLWLIFIMFFVMWCSRNYCEAIKTEYMVKTTLKSYNFGESRIKSVFSALEYMKWPADT